MFFPGNDELGFEEVEIENNSHNNQLPCLHSRGSDDDIRDECSDDKSSSGYGII